jgi:hypothetical protein
MNRLKHYQWKLDERQTVTLDSNGAGTMSIVPGGAREKWVVNFMTVSTANVPPNSANVPQMIVYRQAAVPGNQLAGTFSALLDTTTDTFVLNMNEGLVFVVSAGDVSSVVTVHIEGVRHVWGT